MARKPDRGMDEAAEGLTVAPGVGVPAFTGVAMGVVAMGVVGARGANGIALGVAAGGGYPAERRRAG